MKIESVKFMLMAQDMDRAVRFYRDAVGLAPKMQSKWWSELAFGDAIVALHGGGDGRQTPTGLGLQVADVDAAVDEVVAAGGKVVKAAESKPREGIRIADVADTEGNIFAISQRI